MLEKFKKSVEWEYNFAKEIDKDVNEFINSLYSQLRLMMTIVGASEEGYDELIDACHIVVKEYVALYYKEVHHGNN